MKRTFATIIATIFALVVLSPASHALELVKLPILKVIEIQKLELKPYYPDWELILPGDDWIETEDLTEDIQSYYMYPNITCQGYALAIFADVDGIDNGGTYGIYDTMAVIININGELYGSEVSGNKELFFTFFETHCGQPNCSVTNSCDRGRFVIRFVDMTAGGFVPNNSSTWTYKTVPSLTFTMSNDGCYDYDDPKYDSITPYMQAKAYKVQNNAISANLIDDDSIQTDAGTYEFTDEDDGIAEVYVTTDYCENMLDDLILRETE